MRSLQIHECEVPTPQQHKDYHPQSPPTWSVLGHLQTLLCAPSLWPPPYIGVQVKIICSHIRSEQVLNISLLRFISRKHYTSSQGVCINYCFYCIFSSPLMCYLRHFHAIMLSITYPGWVFKK